MANAATSKQSAAKSRQGKASRANERSRESDSRELSGERDENYNLISVLYHGLQGADQCAIYADDAEEAGDEELVEMLRQAGRAQAEIARSAKQLLLKRLSGAGADAGDEEDDEQDDQEDDEE